MVVYSATHTPTNTQDTLYALWSLLRDAREQPFEQRAAFAWRSAMAEFTARIEAMLRRDGAPPALTAACDALSRDIEETKDPSIRDVIRVCERLIQMEMVVARMRNQATGGNEEM